MKQAGRIHWLVIVACAALVAILALAFLAGPSAGSTAGDFLRALQAGNVDRLTELSNVPKGEEAKLRKQWEFCIHAATPYYNFLWRSSFTKKITDEAEVVHIKLFKNADKPGSYDEDFEIPMVKVDGRWKVDIYRLTSKLYPALPRASSDLG